MKFSLLSEEIINPEIDDVKAFLENKNVITLYGKHIYTLIKEDETLFYLLDEGKEFDNIDSAAAYIYKEYNEDVSTDIISENLRYMRFHYDNYKHDPNPKIIILDDDYIYDKKGNIVPGQHDILAFNLNYGKIGDKKKINGIASIARKSKKNKLDTYLMIKKNYPESLDLLRQYKKKYIRGTK